ncbi:hypothetical protein WG954_20800 [Lacibacter sp. H375]|uniref:hypothetical protein n=1 Tax=Lacibacter sp. H375 TaxID=3133424 RepID=UPI0030BE571A
MRSWKYEVLLFFFTQANSNSLKIKEKSSGNTGDFAIQLFITIKTMRNEKSKHAFTVYAEIEKQIRFVITKDKEER